jgi:hypothetical protein
MMGAVLRWPEDQLRLLLIESVDRLKKETTEPSAYRNRLNV